MKTQKEFLTEIKELTSQASSPEEAIEIIIKTYPEINEKELRRQFEIGSKHAEKRFGLERDSEITEDLSDTDLESIAGGSFSSWMKKNWPYVLGVSAIIAGGVAIGIKLGKPNAQMLKDANGAGQMQGAHAGFDEGTNIGSEAALKVNPNDAGTWSDALSMMGV